LGPGVLKAQEKDKMNRKSLKQAAFRAALAVAGITLAMGSAQAQVQVGGPSYAGASIGSTDFGTGLKVFLGGKITPIFGWEGQVTSFGSEEYRPGYKQSAWAFGGSGTGRFALNPTLSAIGKVGLHYVRPRRSGPGTSDSDSSIDLGLGAGLLWNFSHTAALRLELENIGGSDGDFASVGLQFSF
jgi:hypothetical protein